MKYWNDKTPIRAIASAIWNTSEYLNIPLRKFGPYIFGLMLGAKLKK